MTGFTASFRSAAVAAAVFALIALFFTAFPQPAPGYAGSQPAGQPQQGPGPLGNDELIARLAQNLNISPDQLRAAIQQTMRQLQAQERAPDQAQRGGPGQLPEPLLMNAVRILEMEPEALGQELAQGKTLGQVALERGADPEAFADQITIEMEQLRLQQMRQQVRQMLDQPAR